MTTRQRTTAVVNEMANACMLTRSRLISRVLTNVYDDALRPFGINSPQFSLLVVMEKLGPATRADIGRFNYQDRSTLTRNLKVMLDEGWIDEVLDASVGRKIPVRVSERGLRLLERAAPAWREAQATAASILRPDGVAVVRQVANRLMSANRPDHP